MQRHPVSFWRFTAAAAVLAAVRLRRPGGAGPTERRRAAVLTGVALAAYQTAYFGAVQDAGLALGTVITLGASPILVGAGGHVFLGERLTKRGAAAIATALLGLLLLVARPVTGPRPLTGIALALLSAVGYSVVTLRTRRTTTAAVLVLLEPATAALLAVLLGEKISTLFVAGSVLLLTAVAVLARDQS